MSLDAFFDPRGVVIVGASSDPSKLGYAVARNLIQGGYGGVVHLVNPKGGALFERTMYFSVAKIPDPVDLASCWKFTRTTLTLGIWSAPEERWPMYNGSRECWLPSLHRWGTTTGPRRSG